MSGSIFYKTSSSNSLSSSASQHSKASLSRSTSALFDIVRDPSDFKSPQLKSSKSVGFSSPSSLFNRLKTENSLSSARTIRAQRLSSSIFNVIKPKKVFQNTASSNFNQMPSKGIESEVIQSKTVSTDVEAKPWTRGRSKDTVSCRN